MSEKNTKTKMETDKKTEVETDKEKKTTEILEKKLEEKIEKKEEKQKASDKDGKGKEKKIVKKDEAVALGRGLHISKKQAMYICSFIKNKNIDRAIADLNAVIKFKKVVPFKGEIPHRKGRGMMSGRYPVKAAGIFVNLLKSLKGNVIVNGMNLEKIKIHLASANWAARPAKSGGRRAKRTHVVLKAKETTTFEKGSKSSRESKKPEVEN